MAASSSTTEWNTPRLIRFSHDYFSRLFRKSFGISPRRWLMEQRVHLASLRLLESNLNISEIADDLGYPDVFLLSRQFKQVMGTSPSRYRSSKSIG